MLNNDNICQKNIIEFPINKSEEKTNSILPKLEFIEVKPKIVKKSNFCVESRNQTRRDLELKNCKNITFRTINLPITLQDEPLDLSLKKIK